MARQWKPENTLSYTYNFADGTYYTIRAGENGVTEKEIMLLHESDHQAGIDERNESDQRDWKFRQAQRIYEEQGDHLDESPMNRISDPRQDVWKTLFPEETEESGLLKKLEAAMEQLTESQRELIYELYGLLKPHVEIAREQSVTPVAIRNRRDKIMKRLVKLLEGNR